MRNIFTLKISHALQTTGANFSYALRAKNTKHYFFWYHRRVQLMQKINRHLFCGCKRQSNC